MSRIKFPVTIAEFFQLFDAVKAKHDADAAASVLIPFFDEQDIDPDDDADARSNSYNAHVQFLSYEKISEEQTEHRNNLFKVVFDDHKKCVQFLKKLYRHAVHKLGEWGVTVDSDGRIVYPPDFVECAFAISQFIDKHDSYPAGTSPLQPFLDENNIDLSVNSTKLNNAVLANADFISSDSSKEEQRELRDELFEPVKEHLRGIGQFLVGLYPNTPHRAGQWGFEIDSSPQKNVLRTFTLSSGEIKTVKNVVIGSKVKNIGSTTLLIRKGTDDDTPPVSLNPNQEFTVSRGYGKMVVENSSASDEGAFKATLNK